MVQDLIQEVQILLLELVFKDQSLVKIIFEEPLFFSLEPPSTLAHFVAFEVFQLSW